jgi:hypothetical protein
MNFFDLLSHPSFISISLLIVTSLFLRIIFQIINQRWFCTYSHTATIFLLPIITFTITKVIANNIALSLGMVGALSIIRFRNPVKSPLELTVYFLLITLGIAASVNYKFALSLAFISFLILLGLFFSEIFFKRVFSKSFYSFSFSEGGITNTLTLCFDEIVDEIESNEFLISASFNSNEFIYVIGSSNKNDLILILNIVKNHKHLTSYDLKIH